MKTRRTANVLTISLAIAAGVVAVALSLAWFFWPFGEAYEPLKKSFDGDSQKLAHTVIVPTLETPIPEDKSAIWCSSFQIAWNRLKEDVLHEPVVLKGAETASSRLNGAKPSDKDLSPQSFYAAAGWAKDGIVEKVRRDMAQKFPGVTVMDLSVPLDGALAYGYLSATIKYKHKYIDGQSRLSFPVGDGTRHAVGSFGFLGADESMRPVRGQAEVLFSSSVRDPVSEFAIDLCRDSADQIVVARIPRQTSLADALATVRAKISAYPVDSHLRTLGRTDSLLVPNMSWRVVHRFEELEGKHFANANWTSGRLEAALQVIDLTMDRSGTEVKSEAKSMMKSAIPDRQNQLFFDEPYLLYLQKRGSEQPFFAMWVANTELLQ
jgi:hypothetical protein